MGRINKYILKNGQELAVRSIVPDDAMEIINFMKKADKETRFLSREPDEFDFSLGQEREFINASIKDRMSTWIVAELDEKIVAVYNVKGVKNRERFMHRASISIIVLKDYWRMGIGRILMEEGIERSRDYGYEQLEVSIITANIAAVSLYVNLGFVVTGIKKNALKYGDGEYADEYIMYLDLTK